MEAEAALEEVELILQGGRLPAFPRWIPFLTVAAGLIWLLTTVTRLHPIWPAACLFGLAIFGVLWIRRPRLAITTILLALAGLVWFVTKLLT